MQQVRWSQQRCSDLFKQISFELLSKSSEQADDHPRQICCCQWKRDLFQIALSWRNISKISHLVDKMFAWQDCSKLFTSCSKLVLLQNCSKLVLLQNCSKLVLLQNCSKLVDNKLVLTSWLAELYYYGQKYHRPAASCWFYRAGASCQQIASARQVRQAATDLTIPVCRNWMTAGQPQVDKRSLLQFCWKQAVTGQS